MLRSNSDENHDQKGSINASHSNPPKPGDPAYATTVRGLNDAFRTTLSGGRVVFTADVAARSAEFQQALLCALQRYDAFDEDSDPYQEHDFGCLDVANERFLWKIDYYDPSLAGHSDNAADPALTMRVLTLMLAEEW